MNRGRLLFLHGTPAVVLYARPPISREDLTLSFPPSGERESTVPMRLGRQLRLKGGRQVKFFFANHEGP